MTSIGKVKFEIKNNYQALCMLWNLANQNDIPENEEVPDYRNL